MHFNPPLPRILRSGLLSALLLTAVGCRTTPAHSDAAPVEGSGSGAAAQPAAPVATVVVEVDGLRLTDRDIVARFEANAFRKGLRPTPKDAVSLAEDQRVIRLFAADQVAALRVGKLAASRGCAVSPEQARQALEADTEGSRLFKGGEAGRKEALRPYRLLTMEVLEQVVADDLLRKCLEERIAASLDEPTLRRRVLIERELLEVELASIRLPLEAGRLSNVLTTRAADIEKRYAEVSDQHWLPPRTEVSVVRIPKPADAAALDALKEQMRGWREQAAASAEAFAAIAKAHSADASAQAGGVFGPVSENQMPLAFSTPVGETTPLFESETDLLFARVERRLPPERRPLDDAMRSEIAATLAREAGPTDKERALALQVQAAMKSGGKELDALKRERGVTFATPKPFRRTANGMVPGVGPNLALSDRLFADLKMPGDMFAEPYFSGFGLVVVRLVSRSTPTDAEIATAVTEQREETAGLEAREQVDALLAGDKAQPEIKIEPISVLLRSFDDAP